MAEYAYPDMRRIVYDCGEAGTAQFVPVCAQCSRFVKPDEAITVGIEGLKSAPNATCSRCGRVEMLFEGFF